MAIETRTVRGSLTEIYINGGGNFITQAAPTNFHGFWPRKVLNAGESVEDYMEVTAAQKASIEAADAKWVAPSEELIADAEAAGAVWNRGTGYFELNRLVDITAEQMRDILAYYQQPLIPKCLMNSGIRTNLPFSCEGGTSVAAEIDNAFFYARSLEVLRFFRNEVHATSANNTFNQCKRLRVIIGKLHLNTINAYCFNECNALEDIELHTRSSVDLHWSPLLSLESIQYMVDNAANTSAITITLHADAYARLTDELIAQAAEKQITFAST